MGRHLFGVPYSLALDPDISFDLLGYLVHVIGHLDSDKKPSEPDYYVEKAVASGYVVRHADGVLMLNDDFTPMEFVVMVLQEFFSKDRESATQIMLKIHLDGKGVCGVYSKDVAATKVDQVMDAARKSGHPLQCVAEPIE